MSKTIKEAQQMKIPGFESFSEARAYLRKKHESNEHIIKSQLNQQRHARKN